MSVQSGYAAAIPSAEFRLTSSDGLHVARGMGEHMWRYVGMIEALISGGLTVYGNDHRRRWRKTLSGA
jgi:alpha-beta hydrolase superfamily lysophospholipase